MPRKSTIEQKVLADIRSRCPDNCLSTAKFILYLFHKPDHHKLYWEKIANKWKAMYRNKRYHKILQDSLNLVWTTDYNRETHRCRKFSLAHEERVRVVQAYLKSFKFINRCVVKEQVIDSSPKIFYLEVEADMQYQSAAYKLARLMERAVETRDWSLVKKSTKYVVDLKKEVELGIIPASVKYVPKYRKGITGRYYEVGGGVQNLPRELKQANYEGIPDCYNYDIRSCAMAGIVTFLENHGNSGIDYSALTDYISNPQAKYEYAARADLDVDLWKDCLNSMMFGSKYDSTYGSPYKAINAYYTEAVARFKLDRFLEVVNPLGRVLAEWLLFIKKYAEESMDDKGFIYNACNNGVHKDQRNRRINNYYVRDSKFLSAFYTQGLEVAFIMYLINNQRSGSYKVLSYEFDGLVTVGKIPEGMIEEARRVSGFNRAVLEIKNFA